MRPALRFMYRSSVRRLSREFVAGPGLRDALRAAARSEYDASLAYWNPIGESPEIVAAHYFDCVVATSTLSRPAYVSVKLPALGPQAARLTPVLDEAIARSVRVHFDSLGAESADAVFDLIDGRRSQQVLGCTLPGRWRRSQADAAWATVNAVPVRIVKGEWPGSPDIEPKRGFMEVVDVLAGGGSSVSVATHDAALAEQALRVLIDSGTCCDIETLYGRNGRAVARVAGRLGVPVAIYIPFGEAYLGYAATYLRRHPIRVAAWLVRDVLREMRH